MNNDQPAQPPGGRIAYQRMIIRIANKFFTFPSVNRGKSAIADAIN
ncbi:MAG: hypothetical protein LBT09_06030 [Planctomycetaceae bacterium]|nr:hypothetical protein [Planctomycetaceae bacterium]